MSAEQSGGQEAGVDRIFVVSELNYLYRTGPLEVTETPERLVAVIAGTTSSDRALDRDAVWGISVKNYVENDTPFYEVDIDWYDPDADKQRTWTSTYNARDPQEGLTSEDTDRRIYRLLAYAQFTEEAAKTAAGKLPKARPNRVSVLNITAGNPGLIKEAWQVVAGIQESAPEPVDGNIVTRALANLLSSLRRPFRKRGETT